MRHLAVAQNFGRVVAVTSMTRADVDLEILT
jgi:hypothetical protein